MGEEKAAESTAPTQQKLKIKKSRHNRRVVVSETPIEVITSVVHRAYKGEKISNTVRKDHKYDPNQRQRAGNRAL